MSKREMGKMLGLMFFPDILERTKRKRIRKLVMWSVIMVGCILANCYQYIQKPNPGSFWTMIVLGIMLVIIVGIHLNLLKRGY